MPNILELHAFALPLPPGSQPIGLCGEPHFLPVIRDQGGPWFTLASGVNWMYAGEVIRHLCAGRALQIIDRSLRIQDVRCTTPEGYLTRWRQALARPLPMQTFALTWGVIPTAVLLFDTRAISLARTCWSNAPKGGLEALLALYQDSTTQTQMSGHAACSVAIDLTTPLGPQHAWWMQAYLHQSARNPYPLKVTVDFVSERDHMTRAFIRATASVPEAD